MIPLTLQELAAVVGGTVSDAAGGGAGLRVTGPAFVDSRTPEPDGLFVAVAGEHVDGHDHAREAVRAGAAAVLGARPTGVPTVVVPDTVTALGELARYVADRVTVAGGTVLALTGSQGKTGTKDLLAQVLRPQGETVATAGNFNNEIGVPLTVLRATEQTRYLVVEMGARGVGHIARLCGLAPPGVAAVLNVGTAHLGEFGSVEAIARAKGEIVAALPPEGVAVLNADDPVVREMAGRTPGRVLTFGEAAGADLEVTGVELDEQGRPRAVLGWQGEQYPVALQLAGRHQLANAAAAVAMAVAAGVDAAQATTAVSAAVAQSPWRMQLHHRADGMVVVNDAYNANPASMVAALETLVGIGRGRALRTVAVLGEMRELGEDPEGDHRAVGAAAAERGVDVVVAVGEAAAGIADGAAGHGGWQGEVVRVPTRDAALGWVRHNGTSRDVVLVKASRGAALEHVAAGLIDDEETTG